MAPRRKVDYSAVANEEPRGNRFDIEEPVRRPGRPPAPHAETPREKFVRLVASRTDTLLNALNNLRKLADKEYYPYSETDIEAIVGFLRQQTEITERSFRSGREVAGGVMLPTTNWES